MSDLKDIIERADLAPPRLRLLCGDKFFDPRCFKGVTDGKLQLRASYDDVFTAVYRDSTLVVDNIGPLLPSVNFLCDWVEALLPIKSSANLYCAVRDAGRFGAHYDQHDVLAVQLQGEKHWVFPNDVVCMEDGVASNNITLQVGDALYIPEGVVHDVSATGILSIHISLALS
ncbi:JmjC domain-containing protein [Pseudomonas sp. BIC9C]|uniref:JmjC domain-containing protein n=1 Tax=Pseudomonas sp. BIC9C TaxID=3078458 RepID=UPI002AD3D5DA|nr:cupin domain-containing protein [Pseudomonas sp. BIC9C]